MTTTVYLVRHAEAESSRTWRGARLERPLTDIGERQAQGIAEFLSSEPITEVRASPARRCIMTATAIADRLGLSVIVDRTLLEGNFLTLPTEPGMTLLCAHGDNIPELLERHKVRCHSCDTGAAWRLEINSKGEVLTDSYIETCEAPSEA